MPRKPSAAEEHTVPLPLMERHLFDARHVMVVGDIHMEMAKRVCSQLLALSHASQDPITLWVNSPGGHVESGDMIHDMLGFLSCPVRVIGSGWIASAGALIYLGVPKEQRFALPNSRFLLHQPSGGMQGSAVDIEIQAREIIKMKERLNCIIAEATGQPISRVREDTERDYWLDVDEAISYGIVSRVIRSIRDLPAK